MIDFAIKHAGMPRQSFALDFAVEVVSDLRPTFDAVAHPWLLEHMERQFATSGGHGGQPWAPLTGEPKYARMKRKLGASMAPLRWRPGEQERLYPSLTRPKHPLHRYRSMGHRFIFGTRVKYSKRLQQGGVGPKKEPFPPRQILAFTVGQLQDFMSKIRRDILRRIEAARRGGFA